MKLSNELIQNAKKCKNVDEIILFAHIHGVEITEEEAKEAFEFLRKKDKIQDYELTMLQRIHFVK